MTEPTPEFTELDAALEDLVPARVRTITYAVAGVVGALATAALPVVAALAPQFSGTATAVVAAVVGLCSTIAGLVGFTYRPTR